MISPVNNLIWDLLPSGFFESLDNLKDGDSGSSAEVVDLHPCESRLHNLLESRHVPFRDVHDVDVVAAAWCKFQVSFTIEQTKKFQLNESLSQMFFPRPVLAMVHIMIMTVG